LWIVLCLNGPVLTGAFSAARSQKSPLKPLGFPAREEGVYPGIKRVTLRGINHNQRKGSDYYVSEDNQGSSSREEGIGK
jgi:hypothetical protein